MTHRLRQVARCSFVSVTGVQADPSWRPFAGGVAQRRRERRLRSWFRHEQQTVRMAIATCTHHSAVRRQTKARAREEGHRNEYDALRRQKPLLSRCSSSRWRNCCARYAADGTAGGSADDHILFLAVADYGAARRHSSSWSWMAKRLSPRFSS